MSFLCCEPVGRKLCSSEASFSLTVFPPIFSLKINIFQKSIQICVCFWHSLTSLPVLLASCIPTLLSTHTSLCCHVPHRTSHWVFHLCLHTQAILSRGVGLETFAHKDFFHCLFYIDDIVFSTFFFPSCFSQLYSSEIL